MRADYCPMANEPCQSMCDVPCSAHRLKPADESDMAIYKAIAENYTAPQAQQPAVEPYGHVTVSRLSQRFENHTDQYTFYPAGQAPYLDNVDECVPVFTAPPPPADVPLLTDQERYDLYQQVMRGHHIDSLHYWLQGPARKYAIAIEQAVRQKAGLK